MYRNTVLFYTQNRWAFGQIHQALVKRLWGYNIYSHVLDWGTKYTYQEFDLLKLKYNTFASTPEPLAFLKSIGIPASRIVIVAHHEKDLVAGVAEAGAEAFEDLHGFAVVNSSLITVAANLGIKRVPSVVKVGIDFDQFYMPINNSLKVIGYAGEIKSFMSDNTDFKRSHLVSDVVTKTKLQLKQHEYFNYLCMPGYYTTIDALLVPSKYETAGLPALEAAASGKLVISTNVGYFDGSYGISCRMPDDEFIFDATQALEQHKDPQVYKSTCERSQQYIKENYDWSNVIAGWLDLLD
jgi:hypothetical protein